MQDAVDDDDEEGEEGGEQGEEEEEEEEGASVDGVSGATSVDAPSKVSEGAGEAPLPASATGTRVKGVGSPGDAAGGKAGPQMPVVNKVLAKWVEDTHLG